MSYNKTPDSVSNSSHLLFDILDTSSNYGYLKFIQILNFILLFRLCFFWLTISFTTLNRALSFFTHCYTSLVVFVSFCKLFVLLAEDSKTKGCDSPYDPGGL